MTLDEEVKALFGPCDLYQVLQVAQGASQEEIKKAYLRRSLELHPDKISDPNQREESKCKFQLLTKIYQILGNSDKRIQYDSQYQFSTTQNQIDSTIFEDIPLVNCDEHETFYSYDCRCSGQFILKKEIPSHSLAVDGTTTTTQASGQPSAFIVDCESCSSSIRISL